MQKNIYRENFSGPPSDRKKIPGPLFLPWKLRVNPIEKHVNSIFNGKSVVIFFRFSPLTRVKSLNGPLFASAPLTSVCERSLKASKNFMKGSAIVAKLFCLSTIPTQSEWTTVLRSGEGWPKACGAPCSIKLVSITFCERYMWILCFLQCVASGYCNRVQVSRFTAQFCKDTERFNLKAIQY